MSEPVIIEAVVAANVVSQPLPVPSRSRTLPTFAPAEFPFSVLFDINNQGSTFMQYLGKLCQHDMQQYEYTCMDSSRAAGGQKPLETLMALPKSGLHTFAGIDVFVLDGHKHGRSTLFFRSREDYETLHNAVEKARGITQTVKSPTPIFRYNAMHNSWQTVANYEFKPRSQIVGYDHYIDTIIAQIRNHEIRREHLRAIGEHKSLNFLLYGAPGQGKSSIIRIVASELECPLFIINPLGINYANIGELLNPTRLSSSLSEQCKMKIIIFEDFDRFLADERTAAVMAEFLNGLDGVSNASDLVRIFTGNDCAVIMQNKALINRISGKFKFGYPTHEMYRNKLVSILVPGTKYTEEELTAVVEAAAAYQLTMRPFISFAVRFLFDENPMQQMLANFSDFD